MKLNPKFYYDIETNNRIFRYVIKLMIYVIILYFITVNITIFRSRNSNR